MKQNKSLVSEHIKPIMPTPTVKLNLDPCEDQKMTFTDFCSKSIEAIRKQTSFAVDSNLLGREHFDSQMDSNLITFDQNESNAKHMSLIHEYGTQNKSLRSNFPRTGFETPQVPNREVYINPSNEYQIISEDQEFNYREFSNKFSEISPIPSTEKRDSKTHECSPVVTQAVDLEINTRDMRLDKGHASLEKFNKNSILLIDKYESHIGDDEDSLFDPNIKEEFKSQQIE